MSVFQTFNNNKVLVWTNDIEQEAISQLHQMSQLDDVIFKHIAVMPDVHWGNGATVGSVIPSTTAIIPAAVGVDIGCGMIAVKTNLNASTLPDNLREVREKIERNIPVGFDEYKESRAPLDSNHYLFKEFDIILQKHPVLEKMSRDKLNMKIWKQCGTLGGGNHFIELCLDEEDNLWIMLHSGSRGVGNIIGRHFIELAKKDMERIQKNLPNKELSYLSVGTEYFDDYINAVKWAQDYASINRDLMLEQVIKSIKQLVPNFQIVGKVVNCHHNYISEETHYGEKVYITRKGAIKADIGDIGIIPGSMGTKSYIVEGLGNQESFCSCSHGAGRRMSRGKAKKAFNRQDLEQQTSGVECRKDNGVLDEIPGAYKDIDVVMENQKDLVRPIHTLKQILCVKG
jgi:tRNA-splicing ligase RtcB